MAGWSVKVKSEEFYEAVHNPLIRQGALILLGDTRYYCVWAGAGGRRRRKKEKGK